MIILSKEVRALRAGIIAACTLALLLAACPAEAAQRIALVMNVPAKTASMSVQLIYVDGTQSEARKFNAPK